MPEFIGRFRNRVPIATFLQSGTATIAGVMGPGYVLRDQSGQWALPANVIDGWELENGWSLLAGSIREWRPQELLFKKELDAQPERVDHQQRSHLLKQCWLIHRRIREFFWEKGFQETVTPAKVDCPGMEPYLDAFATGDQFLRTSPELHMKRLLASGNDRIFQLAPCFRDEPKSKSHRHEFTMLEWYRSFADLSMIQVDLSDLLIHLAPLSANPDYFRREPVITTCCRLFEEIGCSLKDQTNPEPMKETAKRLHIHTAPDDDWETLFFRLFLHIEPTIGAHAPTFVYGFPATQAALSKLAVEKPGQMPTCHRFECFLGGWEIANAFYELCDPAEQLMRFENDRATRRTQGKIVYDIDRDFIDSLHWMPPSAGIALGVDRLTACLLNQADLDSILPF